MHLSSLLCFLLLHLPHCHQPCPFCDWLQAELPKIHVNLLEAARKLERSGGVGMCRNLGLMPHDTASQVDR